VIGKKIIPAFDQRIAGYPKGTIPVKTYLSDLRESNEFLNMLLDNMNTAVVIVDENYRIYQFNNAFLNLFDKAADSPVGEAFGDLTGCVHAVQENKACGETSQCSFCMLRQSAIRTLVEDGSIEKRTLERIFYFSGRPEKKYLEFTTRQISFEGRRMSLILIYDITEIQLQKLELQENQKQLKQDLQSAAGIQQSLLPDRSPRIRNLSISWRFEPCEEIGGDIFNLHRIDDNHVGIYMLDVCGHGVPAALISVAVSQFMHSDKGLMGNDCQLMSPETILRNLDEAFPFERFDTYFSIICLTIDITSGLMSYSCAGHPPPVLLRTDGTLELLEKRGPAIGAGFETVPRFGQEDKKLHMGDKVILYTDGLVESRNAEGEAFGVQRFLDALKIDGGKTVDVMVNTLYDKLKVFRRGAKPDDDISLLGLEYVETGEVVC